MPRLSIFLLALTAAAPTLANVPPATPVITEPGTAGQVVNAADVHMETAPFSDPDAGDTHACSDWEIWRVNQPQRVWAGLCVTGPTAVHVHLGDGMFEGSLAGQTQLAYDADYELRVRHKDSSGDPATQWSGWATRLFHTGPPTTLFPMALDDVLSTPAPQWVESSGVAIVLPPAAQPPRLVLESAAGELLLELRAGDGTSNVVTNPPALAGHVPVRVRIDAADAPAGLTLAISRLAFTDHEGMARNVYLPVIGLGAGESAFFWVSNNGSTYVADIGETEPNFATLGQGAPVPWDVLLPGYVVEIVASGFQLPVNIAFVPAPGPLTSDPLYYVTELYGTIKVVTRGGDVSDYASDLLNFSPTGLFPGSGEQGLAGIVVEPVSGDLYATMLYDSPAIPGTHYPKVVRFQSMDGGLTAATQTTILDMPGQSMGQSHQISNITIGPDGKLYVHMGDGFNSATAQNLDSYRGKILRMDLDGSAPSDNPFYNAGNGINARDYVFAYGVRNPFGGAWRAADGSHYELENGPSVDRLAKVIAGRNFTWSGVGDSQMTAFAIYNWAPSTGPVNLAFIEPQTFGGSGFPANMMDRALVTLSGATWATGPSANGKRIVAMQLGGSENLISGPTPIVAYNGGGKATAVALAAGPDGLYFSDLYKDQGYTSPIDAGANILRVRYVGTIDFMVDFPAGTAPLCVQFTDASSVSSPTDWLWEFGDGQTSTLQNPVHTYLEDDEYTVRLRVTHAGGTHLHARHDYITVGQRGKVAFIGDVPLSASDAGIVSHLTGLDYAVDAFDDDPANRPTAVELAAEYHLVIGSSTMTSANIGSEFRNVAVPFVFWEHLLLQATREAMATSSLTATGQTSIQVLPAPHPITVGLALGLVTFTSSSTTYSFGADTLGPQVQLLAHRSGNSANYAVLAAEKGAALLGGHTAAGRRVFLPIENATWPLLTTAGRKLFNQAVGWAIDRPFRMVGDFDGDGDIDLSDHAALADVLNGPGGVGLACGTGDLDGDADIDLVDVATFMLLIGSGS